MGRQKKDDKLLNEYCKAKNKLAYCEVLDIEGNRQCHEWCDVHEYELCRRLVREKGISMAEAVERAYTRKVNGWAKKHIMGKALGEPVEEVRRKIKALTEYEEGE